MMRKTFKIGDRVQYVGTNMPEYIGVVGEINYFDSINTYVEVKITGEWTTWWNVENIRLVPQENETKKPSPFVVESRKFLKQYTTEIVSCAEGTIDPKNPSARIKFKSPPGCYFRATLEDLKKTVEFLNGLIEVLEDARVEE